MIIDNVKVHSKISTPQLQNGFYVYKAEIYTSKDDVLDKMNENGDYDGKIHFYYNDHVYSKIDWSVEPEIGLEQLYINRAKQLRDKYDYLILAFSGGSDSTEILRTFLDNDIFIDEIQTVNHQKLFDSVSEGYKKLYKSFAIYHSEYKINALPLLKEVAIRSPNTKITVIDASDFLIDETINMKFTIFGHDGTAASTRSIVTKDPKTIFRSQHKYNEKNLNKEGLKVAYIEGIEKPAVTIKGKKMYFSFSDHGYQSTRYINKEIANNMYNIEAFFWSADAPLIPIKQSHIIKKVLETDKDIAELYFGSSGRVDKHRLMNPYIYKYSANLIQARKENLFDSKELSLIENVFGDVKGFSAAEEFNQTMLKKYQKFKNRDDVFEGIRSRDYFIGNMNYNHEKGR